MNAPAQAKGVLINVMGREFRVAAPEGEDKQLLASVDYLNRKMREIKDTGKVVGNERIAIMAALNIAHELLSSKDGRAVANSFDEIAVKRRMAQLENIIEKALSEQDKLF